MIVRAMVTQCLVIHKSDTQLLQLHPSSLFRQLQVLDILCDSAHEISILPYLAQIRRMDIGGGIIPVYPLSIDLQLVHTLRSLRLSRSSYSWMIGRTFNALKEFKVNQPRDETENQCRREGLQVNLPARTSLKLENCSMGHFLLLSCSSVQIFHWGHYRKWSAIDEVTLKSSYDFLLNLSCLQKLDIFIPQYLGLDSLLHFVFCGAREQGVWPDIRGVELSIWLNDPLQNDAFTQMVGHQQHYEKWWKEFTFTKDWKAMVAVRAYT